MKSGVVPLYLNRARTEGGYRMVRVQTHKSNQSRRDSATSKYRKKSPANNFAGRTHFVKQNTYF